MSQSCLILLTMPCTRPAANISSLLHHLHAGWRWQALAVLVHVNTSRTWWETTMLPGTLRLRIKMTRLETLHRQISEIDQVSSRVFFTTFAIVCLCIFLLVIVKLISIMQYLAACIVLAPAISWVLNNTWEAQQRRNERRSSLCSEMKDLREKILHLFLKYDARKRGETFKKAYSLQGRGLRELEEALAVGMFHEKREVFVAAFIRNAIAVRVTASIGSPYKCSAADNPGKWGYYMGKLRCTELRQYHNHPVHNGLSSPSLTDIRTAGKIESLLGAHSAKLRCLIIFWNPYQEWKVLEYGANGKYWISHEYDASAQHEIHSVGQLPLNL